MSDLFETNAAPQRKQVIIALKLNTDSLFGQQVSWEEEERNSHNYSEVSSNFGCFHLSTILTYLMEFQELRIMSLTSIVKTYSSGHLKAC